MKVFTRVFLNERCCSFQSHPVFYWGYIADFYCSSQANAFIKERKYNVCGTKQRKVRFEKVNKQKTGGRIVYVICKNVA